MNKVNRVKYTLTIEANVPEYIGQYTGIQHAEKELVEAHRAAASKLAKQGVYVVGDPDIKKEFVR